VIRQLADENVTLVRPFGDGEPVADVAATGPSFLFVLTSIARASICKTPPGRLWTATDRRLLEEHHPTRIESLDSV
jgi:hypothetical protein